MDERSVHDQKELRIIDTLEPLLNQHRLVIDRQIIVNDSTEDLAHSLVYQLTRLTKDRNCLAHDDSLDALEGACTYWTEKLDLNIVDAEKDHLQAAKDELLDKWMEEVTDHRRPENRSMIANV